MRDIEKKECPAESLLDMLHDNYNLTVKELRDILRQTECYEALQILEGRGTQFQPNIDVSDDENIKVNNLSHLGGRSVRNEDKTSADFNIELSEKEGPEKVIENISAPFCREPQEHEHFKCEAYPESSSSVSESDSKSIQSNQLDSDVIQSSENQVETTIDPVEAETDQENKNAKMDAVCLSEDISANLSEGNITDTAMECVTTASVISNKIQNWNPESTEEGGEVSGIQAQGDANLLHSEKPPDQEMVRLQQEIQTQPNLSSFRDLQRSVPTELGEVSVLQAQGDANFVRSEKPPDQEMVRLQLEIQTQPNLPSFRDLQRSIPAHENDRLSTLPASEQNQNITRTNVSHYQGFEDGQKSDARNSDMSQMCIVDRKSKNEIKEDFSLVGKQVIQPNPELTPQEVSNCGSNLDACAVMAEGDQNLKQSALPPNLDHQNFKREIGTQQSTVEDCPEQSQQSNSNTGVSEAHQGEADSLRNQNSFRDIQHSVPEYRTGDLENPNSSLPRNVDSLVMDEEETFLKERHRPLLK
ncbi:uncharacterized protein LOC117344199 [Pecten maximus]|uniref:uncharacterized protein LOC117344199 n=1 Tax=Pecten maximus TaxID=6579 RepID=UPI001458A770|nr:uncharacterized protein LOC117344199 [Pecten maximus]